MRRYFRHILLSLISVICTVSCVEELEDPNPIQVSDAPTVLVPRVKSFTNQYITKAGYESNEKTISSLAVLIFNENGEIVNIQESEETSSITLNKSMLGSPEHRDKLSKATVVMFANIDIDNVKNADGSSIRGIQNLEKLEDYICHFDAAQTVITKIDDTFKGFPMIGQKEVNLTPTRNSQAAEEIPLKILYAKINFEISVTNGTENTGSDMKFTLNSYSVYNISKATKLNDITTTSDATVSSDYSYKSGDTTDGTGNTITLSENNISTLNDSKVQFTFYIAESRYNHNSDLKGIYPSDDWLTTDDTQDGQVKNGVKSFYDDLIQQYKPKLANVLIGKPAAGLASYVLLNGTYVDYRGTSWNVDYTVYLGKDNAQNFHVDRNSEYTNYITIKGIRNNDSYIDRDDEGNITSDQHVWIDHRVNVSTNDPSGHVAITRETLIDSHIEVRPLRVTWPEGAYAGVRVYLPTNSDGTTPVNWIGIERFTGSNNQEGAVYCYQNGKSIGKRKYFTTGLISELQSKGGELGVQTDNGKKFIYLLNGECAWIYFDENTSTSDRTADIKLAFYSAAGSVQAEEIYQIKQRGLQSIGGYTVESYEEYLHSYDSADKYNLSTNPADYTQQGLSWGLANRTISKDIIVSATSLDMNGIQNYVDQRYDYFHKSDVPPSETYYTYQLVDGTWTNASYGTGLIFTDRASAKEGITIKDMGTVPDNAYQYCLSKNKFNEDADGNHTLDIHWYLPDVYELEAVLTASQANTAAEDFGSDTYYWSSQPSFGGLSLNIPLINREVSIKEEVVKNARAVSVTDIKDVDRSTHNRIRCFYSATGIKADMTERTPDGIGGNYSFYMKAWKDNTKSSEAYFNFLMPELQRNTKTTTDAYDYNDNSFPYPTFDNPGSYFGYFDNVVDGSGTTVKGFGNNPLDQAYWSPHEDDASYFYALKDFPGLTAYELVELEQWWTGQGAYRPTSTKKSDTQIVTTSDKLQLTRNLPGASLSTLDHLTGGDMLKISFSNENNSSKAPYYMYSENDGSKEVTTTRYWKVPTYASATYTPKAESVTKTYTSTKQGTGGNYEAQIAIDDAIADAKANASEDAKKMAHTEYPNRTYTYGAESYTTPIQISHSTSGLFGRYDTYVYEVTCSIDITSTATASPITYYKNASNAGWDEGTSNTKELNGIETDQLVMYSGNSLTVSLADPYKNDYEITKVKVHYSGNNFIKEVANGGALGALVPGLVGTDKIYTRFIDSTIELPQSITIPKGGSSEGLQLIGMDYYEDYSSGEGSHQWTGDGRASVTLELVDYFLNNDAGNNSYTYKYATASTDLSKYIIIDKIEVKCTKKSTAEQ